MSWELMESAVFVPLERLFTIGVGVAKRNQTEIQSVAKQWQEETKTEKGKEGGRGEGRGEGNGGR